jgi:hypothetical protein
MKLNISGIFSDAVSSSYYSMITELWIEQALEHTGHDV